MTNEVWSDGFLAVSVTAIMSILIASVITLFAVNMTRTDKEQFSVGLTFGACIINEKNVEEKRRATVIVLTCLYLAQIPLFTTITIMSCMLQ